MKIGVIGLGYVGLPLAVRLAMHYETFGFDINKRRIEELNDRRDVTLEVNTETFQAATKITFTNEIEDLREVDVAIITVPTPIDDAKVPDLTPLIKATEAVSRIAKKGITIVYESTVYPGVTENTCVPIIEEITGGKLNDYFFVGYSPERINPGDKIHTIENVNKIVSASDEKTLNLLSQIYSSIINADIYKAESIKVAEAAKVIENVQRDINIALMNEFSVIFSKMGIDTSEVLNAAASKWNFLKFKPGLVGGHCIGVDPYYLAHQAKRNGSFPELILAGRRINDSVPQYIVNEFLYASCKVSSTTVKNIAVFGVTFKENVPDIRNSQVVEIIKKLIDLNFNVDVFDPLADPKALVSDFGIKLSKKPKLGHYDGVIYAVPHHDFGFKSSSDIKQYGKEGMIFFDLKAVFDKKESSFRL